MFGNLTYKSIFKKVYLFAFVSLFLMPFLLVLFQGTESSFRTANWFEFFEVFFKSMFQAMLSAIFSVVLGLISALGLLRLSKKKNFRFLEVLIWLPNLLPSIVIILSSISIFNFFMDFPYGIIGVVILHSFLNIGICSLAFLKIIEFKMGEQAELALVEGSTKIHFLRKSFLPSMANPIASVFIFVFIFCLSSFSIPLIVGGMQATTVDVLIFEQIKINANWSQATLFGLLQIGFVLSFYFLVSKLDSTIESSKKHQTHLLQVPFVGFLPVIISILLILGLLAPSINSLFKGIEVTPLKELLDLSFTSFSIGFSVGFFTILSGILFLFVVPNKRFQNILVSLGMPSSVIFAFGFYLIGKNNGFFSIFKLILALSFIFFIPLYKIFLHQSLFRLDEQIRSAQIFGASHFLIIKKIILPQVWPALCYMGGASALWACGDFAISSVLLEKDFTLALHIKNLLSSYRLELASLLSLLLLFIGGSLLFIFWRVADVFDKEPRVSS